nr:MAG TPA: hypothetical protein [Caudoviricetes sp.]
MKRLTFEGNFCEIARCKDVKCPYDTACSQKQVWERLKQYEDTGLSPEKVSWMKEVVEAAFDNDTSRIERAHNLHVADKEGRLAIFPCKGWLDIVFGDQVLFWGIDTDYIEEPIREISLDDANRISWYDGYDTVYLIGYDENGERWEFSPHEIGKTVFLTREEAEKALAEMEGKA